jgi:hypothetical protein
VKDVVKDVVKDKVKDEVKDEVKDVTYRERPRGWEAGGRDG